MVETNSRAHRMERPYQGLDQQVPGSSDEDVTAFLDENDDEHSHPDSCHGDSCGKQGAPESDLQAGIRNFFRALLRAQWRQYDSLEQRSSTAYESFTATRRKKDPLLQVARSFDSSNKNVLSIPSDEVVLPGSELQRQMSLKMSETLEAHNEEECVICMEPFDPTNPRMPTECGCGTNNTFFHLPGLFQWVEHSPDCPACRQTLKWEEF